MLNTITTFNLEEQLDKVTFTPLAENVYRIQTKTNSFVLEVLAIDLAMKTLKIRHNHTVYDMEFKNKLDLVLDKMGIKRSVETINTDVKAPMPGKVIDIVVKEGASVSKGDPIVILEAMKMENVLKAESDAVIKKININKGESVEKNQVLIELDLD
jgi:acetyl/propionyl-CoA carboxylase alpha subunit